MAVPWSMTLWMSKMVWVALCGWVFSCLSVADEIASALRSGDMGPFHVIYYMLGEKLTEDAVCFFASFQAFGSWWNLLQLQFMKTESCAIASVKDQDLELKKSGIARNDQE